MSCYTLINNNYEKIQANISTTKRRIINYDILSDFNILYQCLFTRPKGRHIKKCKKLQIVFFCKSNTKYYSCI